MKKLINLNLTGVTRGIPLMKQYRNLFIILTVALFLTACGGGGGTSLVATGGGDSSTSPGGGGNTSPGGGGNPPPEEQKDIATLIMDVETAVEAIDATTPTQAQVNKANASIMAADAAIAAAGAGVDTSMHTTRLNELRPTVTVTAAELAVGAINATEPIQEQIDAANMAIMAANDAITAAMMDPEADVDTSMYTPRLAAVAVTAAQLAVMAIDATEPTQAQVDAANTAITAANAAIGALAEGTAKTDYTTDITNLQPDVTVAEQTVGILTAIEAVEMAVEALEPHHQATQAQIDAANEAIGKVLTLVGESMLEQNEKLRYIAVAGFLGQSVDMARQFVDADVDTAKTAQDDAMTIEQKVRAETGESIAAFGDENQLLIAAMGVSKGIADAATDEIAAIEDEVEKIERELQLAMRAKANLVAEAAALRKEKTDIETQIKDILGVDTEQEYTDQQILDFRQMVIALEGAATALENDAGVLEAQLPADVTVITTKETEITDLETEIAALEDGTCPACNGTPDPVVAASKRVQLEGLKDDLEDFKMEAEGRRTAAETKRMEATTKRTEATEKKADLDKIDEIEPDIQIKEAAAQALDTKATTAQGHIDAINGILTPLKADLLRWQGVVGDDVAAAESEKAELVLAMLSGASKAVIEDGVLGVDQDSDSSTFNEVIEMAELYDSGNYVFARAMPPTGTMTFEEIALLGDDDGVIDELDEWVFHRRSILNAGGTAVDTAAHGPVNFQNSGNVGGLGLPRNHPAIALSGLDVADFDPLGSDTVGSSELHLRFYNGQLKGIEGTLYCDRRSNCITSSGRFGDGWYFTPVVYSDRFSGGVKGYNTELARYKDSNGDGTYELVSYVDYGMWLEEVDDALLLLRRVHLVGPSASPSTLDFGTDGSNTDTSATYEGEARGLSARKRGIRDDAVTASGHFIADVELNVEFGGSPELAGTIDNFRPVEGQGSGHVNSAWSLTFGGVPDNNNEFDGRYTQGGVGEWSAIPYGASGERPDGFYGGFDATFRNSDNTDIGAAVGVYSTTEKMESE